MKKFMSALLAVLLVVSLAAGPVTAFAEAGPVDPTVSVDKTALATAIEEAEKLVETDYTGRTWVHFAASLERAKAVLENEAATQDEVDSALQGLELDRSYLEAPSTDEAKLKELTDLIDSINVGDYPEACQKMVQRALDDAIAVAGSRPSDSDLDVTISMLNSFKNGELPAKMDELQAAVDAAEKMADYPGYAANLESLLAYAHKVLSYNEIAYQYDVDYTTANIQSISSALEKMKQIKEWKEKLEANRAANTAGFSSEQLRAYDRAIMLADNFLTALDAGTIMDDSLINALLEAMPEAEAGRLPADKTKLAATIEKAKAALKEKEAYKDSSAWQDLNNALNNYGDPYAENRTLNTQAAVDNQEADLERYLAAVLALGEKAPSENKEKEKDKDKDDVPETGDPMVEVLFYGAVVSMLLAAAVVSKKALARK